MSTVHTFGVFGDQLKASIGDIEFHDIFPRKKSRPDIRIIWGGSSLKFHTQALNVWWYIYLHFGEILLGTCK